MIKLQLTAEALADLFTPGACTPHKCIDGLPKDAKLTTITIGRNNDVEMFFEDGVSDLKIKNVIFQHVVEAHEEHKEGCPLAPYNPMSLQETYGMSHTCTCKPDTSNFDRAIKVFDE